MVFFKSLKGDHPSSIGGGSSGGHESLNEQESYAPPPGPPPSHLTQDYVPPPGPPPSHQQSYAPPPGPPPSYHDHDYAPPPGPPPAHTQGHEQPPPYHDWTSIPDTSLLPPPPTLGHKFSPSSNAEELDGIRAHQWCETYPLLQPHQPLVAQTRAVLAGNLALQRPPEYRGQLFQEGTGAWRGRTESKNKDSCLITSLPLYFAMADSPFHTERSKTIYFEVDMNSLGNSRNGEESSLALGFCAVPYPTWRMVGWQRGSLAVHSDDGHRYVNDTDGGQDFTSPFQAGETIGIGITFSLPDTPHNFAPSPTQGTSLKAEAFITRNGKRTDGWNIQEGMDSDTEYGTLGVDGKFDLYGAIGSFGQVSFKASFNSRDWLWQPNY